VAKVARIIDFLKIIIWGPRESYNFKNIDNPGNFGVFCLVFRCVAKVARIIDFLKIIIWGPRIIDFLKSYNY